MNVTETTQEGLRRTWRVIVPSTEIDANVDRRLTEISKTVRLPGFRPGKVPFGMVKKRYGSSVLGEVLEKTVQDSSAKVLKEQAVRPAFEPKIEVVNFAEGADLEYTMAVETLPEIEPADLGDLVLDRLVAPVADSEIDTALERLVAANSEFEPVKKARAAKNGDQLVIDFAGTVDGVAHPGMDGKDFSLQLGSGRFIPGFEEQLVGMKPKEERTVKVTFPGVYQTAELAGKEATFQVTAKELRVPVKTEVDDAFAKKLNLTDLAELKQKLREQLEAEHHQLTRLKLKRALMDALAERHSFPVPEGMVGIEFDAIWRQIQAELGQSEAGQSDADRAEYRSIAERRVRLGLLLGEIGKLNNIQVTQEELNRGVVAEARRQPGREREVLEFYRSNPDALNGLRAPIYEDKVVDHILSKIHLNDRAVTIEELIRDDDAEVVEGAA